MNVLISYSHSDVSFSRLLKRALAKFGITVWMDEHEVLFGDVISERLTALIWGCDFMLVVISPHSITSTWVQWELSIARDRELREGSTRILPLLVKGEFVPSLLEGRRYADFRTASKQTENFSGLIAMLLDRQSGDPSASPYNMDLFKPTKWEELPTPEQPTPHDNSQSMEVVTAPIVGTAYLRPAPDAPPFVQVGDQVRAGDTLIIIEAMKLMNEIEASFAGVVVEILAQDAAAIEFGEPMFVIEIVPPEKGAR